LVFWRVFRLANTNQQVAEQKVYFSGVDAELPIAQWVSVDSESRTREENEKDLAKWGRKHRIEQAKRETNGIIEQRNEQVEK
jgi:hypothetical protein